jgi:hypothetical protein
VALQPFDNDPFGTFDRDTSKPTLIVRKDCAKGVAPGDVVGESLIDDLYSGVVDQAKLVMSSAPVNGCETVGNVHKTPVSTVVHPNRQTFTEPRYSARSATPENSSKVRRRWKGQVCVWTSKVSLHWSSHIDTGDTQQLATQLYCELTKFGP